MGGAVVSIPSSCFQPVHDVFVRNMSALISSSFSGMSALGDFAFRTCECMSAGQSSSVWKAADSFLTHLLPHF